MHAYVQHQHGNIPHLYSLSISASNTVNTHEVQIEARAHTLLQHRQAPARRNTGWRRQGWERGAIKTGDVLNTIMKGSRNFLLNSYSIPGDNVLHITVAGRYPEGEGGLFSLPARHNHLTVIIAAVTVWVPPRVSSVGRARIYT